MLGLFAAKLGEELDVSVFWVKLTIIFPIKLRWNGVDLNRDLNRDTDLVETHAEMPTSDITARGITVKLTVCVCIPAVTAQRLQC